MNINDLTIGKALQLLTTLGVEFGSTEVPSSIPVINNGMVGKYVIVRCRDAGVHAGVLESYNGRECVLTDSRRMWYWKPADRQKFLSGVALHGLDASSKIGASLPRIHLTENCEIIECTNKAEASIRGIKTDEI